MDKRAKQLKAAWRERQRLEALAAMPIKPEAILEMCAAISNELSLAGCDRTRGIARRWLLTRQHDVEAMFAWLDTRNGFCDCQIANNVVQSVEEAMRVLPGKN